MKEETKMKKINRKLRVKDFHIVDLEEKDFRERIETVHMESCFLTEPKCKFGDMDCPANPFSSCIH